MITVILKIYKSLNFIKLDQYIQIFFKILMSYLITYKQVLIQTMLSLQNNFAIEKKNKQFFRSCN